MIVTAKKVFKVSFMLLLLLVLACLWAISSGTAKIPLSQVVEVIWLAFQGSVPAIFQTQKTIIFSLRLPRVILAALVGGALSTAGAVFQALLRNPLADPYILGISSGAAVGAIGTIILGITLAWMIPITSFMGALLTILLVFQVAKARERIQPNTLLLAGVIINAFFAAIIMLLLSMAGSHDLQNIISWLMGDLTLADYSRIMISLPYIMGGVLAIYFWANSLNLILLGEEEAAQLGVEVERTKKILFILASLITAVAVSTCGIIGFVGLIIPHVVRLIWGNDQRLLLPASFLLGAGFLVIADTIARTIIAPTELPVGVITAICGTPFFIYLLRTRRVS